MRLDPKKCYGSLEGRSALEVSRHQPSAAHQWHPLTGQCTAWRHSRASLFYSSSAAVSTRR